MAYSITKPADNVQNAQDTAWLGMGVPKLMDYWHLLLYARLGADAGMWTHEQGESSPKGVKDQQGARSARCIPMVIEAMEKRNRVMDTAPVYGS